MGDAEAPEATGGPALEDQPQLVPQQPIGPNDTTCTTEDQVAALNLEEDQW